MHANTAILTRNPTRTLFLGKWSQLESEKCRSNKATTSSANAQNQVLNYNGRTEYYVSDVTVFPIPIGLPVMCDTAARAASPRLDPTKPCSVAHEYSLTWTPTVNRNTNDIRYRSNLFHSRRDERKRQREISCSTSSLEFFAGSKRAPWAVTSAEPFQSNPAWKVNLSLKAGTRIFGEAVPY